MDIILNDIIDEDFIEKLIINDNVEKINDSSDYDNNDDEIAYN